MRDIDVSFIVLMMAGPVMMFVTGLIVVLVTRPRTERTRFSAE